MKNFISKAQNIHKNKYDYSKVDYKNTNIKVIMVCPIHGEFQQTPKNHLRGQGCRLCGIDQIRNKLSKGNSFIQKAQKIHKNKYDYSKVDYKHSSKKVIIICPQHGEFKQTPNSHLRHGCQKCGYDSLKNNNFIQKAKKIHKNKYDYSKVKYKNINTKVIIICPIHGEFQQSPKNHLAQSGCKKCSNTHQYTTEEFIQKAQKIHKNKYDYSKVDYKNSNTKIKILCPQHGEFEQIAFVHLNGSNCPKCVGRHQYTTEEFIQKAKKIHKNKYDYSKVDYKHSSKKVTIICPKHGEFEQKASTHLKHGCVDCLTYDIDKFISTLPQTHKELYDYSKVNYINDHTKVTIICRKHGEFEQTPSNHKQGHGCPKCQSTFSSGHSDISDYIKSLGYEIINNDRSIIYPFELDVFVANKSIAIEYNGLYWHSFNYIESSEEKNKHYNKYELCEKKGIQLIQIFENEWLNNRSIVESMIKSKLGIVNRIYARKCSIKELNNKEYKRFINNNHIQGYKTASVKLGLYYNNILVSCMSFNQHPKYKWEINRFCNKLHNTVIGGASKLFKYFINNYSPNQIVTYADRRYSNGNLYKQLGFKLDGITRPNYFYVKNKNVYSRQQFMKHKLKKLKIFDPNKTEAENMFMNKYRRIWDAGHYRFIKII